MVIDSKAAKCAGMQILQASCLSPWRLGRSFTGNEIENQFHLRAVKTQDDRVVACVCDR